MNITLHKNPEIRCIYPQLGMMLLDGVWCASHLYLCVSTVVGEGQSSVTMRYIIYVCVGGSQWRAADPAHVCPPGVWCGGRGVCGDSGSPWRHGCYLLLRAASV